MRRGAVAALLTGVLLMGCTDDTPPEGGRSSNSAVSSGSDLALTRSLAETLVDGLQQGANGKISSAEAACLVDELTIRIRPNELTNIASAAPEPSALPKNVREQFGQAFDRCLSDDIAGQLRDRFGV